MARVFHPRSNQQIWREEARLKIKRREVDPCELPPRPQLLPTDVLQGVDPTLPEISKHLDPRDVLKDANSEDERCNKQIQQLFRLIFLREEGGEHFHSIFHCFIEKDNFDDASTDKQSFANVRDLW